MFLSRAGDPMPITTPLTELLGIRHPILSAPMDTIAGSRLTRAVSEAGGFGILGGGYGDRARLEAETGGAEGLCAVRDRLHHLEPGKAARASRHRARCASAGGHAVVRRSRAVRAAHQGERRAIDLPGPERGHGEAGARCRRGDLDRAGDGGGRPRRVAHDGRYRACDRRSRGRARAGRCGRRDRRWPRASPR